MRTAWSRGVSSIVLIALSAACGGGDDGDSGSGGAAGTSAGGTSGAGTGGASAAGGSGGAAGASGGSGGAGAAGGSAGASGSSGSGGSGGNPNCPLGTACNPIPVNLYPFGDTRDTTMAPSDDIDSYSCSSMTDESGPEYFYRLDVAVRSLVTIEVSDGPGVDIDVHLLSGTTGADCIDRNDTTIQATVEPGQYHVVADTWVNASGEEQLGEYDLLINAQELESGTCAMQMVDQRMFWSDCAPGLDCFEGVWPNDGQTYRFLRTPATGPVVKEAHLVTDAETFPGNGWPTSGTDGIQGHYSLSETTTGYAMNRKEPWAPFGEGGSQWGQGATGSPVPVEDEAWYVNMFWRDRPAKGTRMLVRNPDNGRTVVAAAGYETGPGDNTRIGGASEEIHHYLGTTHLDTLVMGFAVDQNLSLGPISCN